MVEGRCAVGEGRAGLIGARRAFEGLVRGAQPLRSDRRERRNRVGCSYRLGQLSPHQALRVCSMGIRRYVKTKAAATPYLPEYAGYFWRRIGR